MVTRVQTKARGRKAATKRLSLAALGAATTAYYDNLTDAEVEENKIWGEFVSRGSENVFRDLERKNADVDQFKAILAAEIIKALDRDRPRRSQPYRHCSGRLLAHPQRGPGTLHR
jgi:Spy/CpxP family protein refolding chaperone